jgi:phosphoserine phosphatase
MAEDRRGPLERLVVKDVEEQLGRPISARGRLTQRSVDAYLRAGVAPRWMQRLNDIEREMARHRRRLERARAALREECGDDAEAFARRWTALARTWRFDDVNELIRQHNEWYPVERDLPMDLRTRDYVRVNGRSYRREELGPGWVLEQFPAD